MKLAIIRCEETSKTCAGWNCFPALRDKTGNFAGYESIEVVGFDTCGGCGKGKTDKIVAKAKELEKHGAEVIHLGNCLASGCPWRKKYAAALRKAGFNIVERTHPSASPEMQARFREMMKEKQREEKRKKKVLEVAGFKVEV
jgi:predicted metal-binding protein